MTKFDARANLFNVVKSILRRDKVSQKLLDEANNALERIKFNTPRQLTSYEVKELQKDAVETSQAIKGLLAKRCKE